MAVWFGSFVDVVNYGERYFTCQAQLVKNMGMSDRFKEERTRLGLSQAALAEKIGATKRSVINWEGGAASPSTDAVAEFAKAGADVLYILTGQRQGGAASSAPALTREEACFLDNYRHCPPEGQAAIEATCAAFAKSKKRCA